MSEPADSRLDVRQLSVTLAQTDVNVVADVSFQVEAGEMLGVVGESGSGKSTVALALLGYARRGLQISTGQVRINGSDVLSLSVAGRRELRGRTIAYVPQDPASALNPGLTVGTQLREVLRSDEERRDAIDGLPRSSTRSVCRSIKRWPLIRISCREVSSSACCWRWHLR